MPACASTGLVTLVTWISELVLYHPIKLLHNSVIVVIFILYVIWLAVYQAFTAIFDVIFPIICASKFWGPGGALVSCLKPRSDDVVTLLGMMNMCL